jgi:hypothetical protein
MIAKSKRSLLDFLADQRFTLGFGRVVFCDVYLSSRMPTVPETKTAIE